MSQFDVTIIGSGPGGYVAAIRMAKLGAANGDEISRWRGGLCCLMDLQAAWRCFASAKFTHTP